MRRLARGVRLPLLMIGAGLALTSKSVRDRAAEAAAPGLERARRMMEDAAGLAQSMRGDAAEAVSSAGDQAAGMARDVQDRAGGVANDLRKRAAEASDTVSNTVRSGMDTASGYAKDTMGSAREAIGSAKETMDRVRSSASDAATAAPAAARRMIQDNAALIAGLGIAIGGIIAAALPATKAEARVMGQASDGMKRTAGEAVQSGFEAAKEAAVSAADAAAKTVSDADLGSHASRMTEGLADRIKEVADDVVTTAFDPSRNSQT